MILLQKMMHLQNLSVATFMPLNIFLLLSFPWQRIVNIMIFDKFSPIIVRDTLLSQCKGPFVSNIRHSNHLAHCQNHPRSRSLGKVKVIRKIPFFYLVQQILVKNRVDCAHFHKSMKLGTVVVWTNTKKISVGAIKNFTFFGCFHGNKVQKQWFL